MAMDLTSKEAGGPWGIGLLVAVAAGAVLYFFPPAQWAFYPRCWFHQWTGLACPGCGGLRAAHALLHGHWAESFRLNPLVWAGLAWLVVQGMRRRLGWGTRRPATGSQGWLWLWIAVLVAFGILRNLPLEPFCRFAA